MTVSCDACIGRLKKEGLSLKCWKLILLETQLSLDNGGRTLRDLFSSVPVQIKLPMCTKTVINYVWTKVKLRKSFLIWWNCVEKKKRYMKNHLCRPKALSCVLLSFFIQVSYSSAIDLFLLCRRQKDCHDGWEFFHWIQKDNCEARGNTSLCWNTLQQGGKLAGEDFIVHGIKMLLPEC